MLSRSGHPVLKRETVAQMTSNQLTSGQRANVWPGFDLLDGRGWGYGVSVLDDGRYGWEGGLGTSWCPEFFSIGLYGRATGVKPDEPERGYKEARGGVGSRVSAKSDGVSRGG